MPIDIPLMVASFFATLWLYSKLSRRFKFAEVQIDKFDLAHASFAALLAHLSLRGYVADAVMGVTLYLIYQILGYLIKRDDVLKDIATFATVYFSVLTAQLAAFGG
jgi:lipopolysaccharide export LptBFGC system permease protein LptF